MRDLLVVGLLVALCGVAVHSYPARKVELGSQLLNEDSEGDSQYDEVEVKPDDAIKKDDVAATKTIAEEAKKDNPESDESEAPASGEEDDDAPKEDTVEASGSGDVEDKSDANDVPEEDPNVDKLTEEASKETAQAS